MRIERVTTENFNEHSLDKFNRFQKVTESLKCVDGVYIYIEDDFIRDWDIQKCRGFARYMLGAIQKDADCLIAICNDQVVGFGFLGEELFGSENQYINLPMLHVSCDYRGRGIGRKLFYSVCEAAKLRGAEKLYISAFPAKETVVFYHSLGCVPAEEINRVLAEVEPYEIRLEFSLA